LEIKVLLCAEYCVSWTAALHMKTLKVRIDVYGLETHHAHHRATERHLPYGVTQCYLPPDTGERAPP